MPRADALPVERIIANTINKTARGDPGALAARIVAALGEAGYRIVPANGMEDTARSTNERRVVPTNPLPVVRRNRKSDGRRSCLVDANIRY
jgi:hypothetical protein